MDKTEHDALWNEVTRLFFNGHAFKPHLARIGKLVREFSELEATPESIRAAKRKYEETWPKVTCTPESLIKWWCTFMPKRREASNGTVQSVSDVLHDEQPSMQEDMENRHKLFKSLKFSLEQQREKTA